MSPAIIFALKADMVLNVIRRLQPVWLDVTLDRRGKSEEKNKPGDNCISGICLEGEEKYLFYGAFIFSCLYSGKLHAGLPA